MSFNFAEICDAINQKQEQIDKIEAQATAKTKGLKQEVDDLEQQLLLAMQAAGLKTIKGKRSVAEIKESEVASVEDYAKFEQYLYRQKALHLLERRIASVAYREMRANLGGKAIPGLRSFTRTRLQVRRA